MRHPRWPVTALCALVCLIYGAFLVAPPLSLAHPLGNFSISHYAGLRLTREGIELRYVLDMAEIPTFQERDSIHQEWKQGVLANEIELDDIDITPYLIKTLAAPTKPPSSPAARSPRPVSAR